MAPLAQYWLASGNGGGGLEMKGGGLHLDEGRVRFWDYVNAGGSITKVQLAALVAGKRRVMPKLYTDAKSANADTLEQSSPEPMQREAFGGASVSNGVVFGASKSADEPLKVYGQLNLVNHPNLDIELKTELDTGAKDLQATGYIEYRRNNLFTSVSAAPNEEPVFEIQWSYSC